MRTDGRFPSHPQPNSPEELAAFARLQQKLPGMYHRIAQDDRSEHTVLVIPSLSLDPRELAKVSGVHHYEERLLYMLMLLRRPRTRLIFVTSQALSPIVIDYYLNQLAGVPAGHARRRLLLFDCADASPAPLSAKILARPRLLERIRSAMGDPEQAHLDVFNSTGLERTLAVRIGIPLYANDPALDDLGTKSGCREVFREAGITFPHGFERLAGEDDIVEALTELWGRDRNIRRAVVKLNEGFSGEGNALFYYDQVDATLAHDARQQIRASLPALQFVAPKEQWPSFLEKYEEMQGIVEEFVEGRDKCSPSSQNRVNALGRPMPISTHDQVLDGQIFQGCTFPADPVYRMEIQEAGMQVARVMAARGVVGRFATDFVSVPDGEGGFVHHAIEVNLRKGGTTHPFLTLRFITDGEYQPEDGEFMTPGGRPKYYFASDTLQSPRYQGLMPVDLIDIAVYHDLHFHPATERGTVFHLMGALSEYGKLGMVCIGDNLQQAQFLYRKVKGVLNQEVSEHETD
jgi:hypothetical protein